MSTMILSAYRMKKSIDIFTEFLEPSISLTYNFFKKQEFVGLWHEMILIEASNNIKEAKEKGLEPNENDKGILAGDPVHTYHELRNKFKKANQKQTSGDPFDQNLKVMVKWDSEYYYIKFLSNGKIGCDLLNHIEESFTILEDYSYNGQSFPASNIEEYEKRGETWTNVLGTEHSFINFLQFDILSPERIDNWVMEPIFGFPQGKDWAYQFPSEPTNLLKAFDVI